MKNIKLNWNYVLKSLIKYIYMEWKIVITPLPLTHQLGKCTWHTSIDPYSCSGFQNFPFYLQRWHFGRMLVYFLENGWISPLFSLPLFLLNSRSKCSFFSLRTHFKGFFPHPLQIWGSHFSLKINSSPELLPWTSCPELWASVCSHFFHITLTWKTTPSG